MNKLYSTDVGLFLDTAASSTASWKRVGKGVTQATIGYNAQVTTEQYINENSATSSVDSYQPQLDTTQTAYKDEEVFEFVDSIRKARGIGSQCETDLLIVYLYDNTTAEGTTTYRGEKNACTIEITDYTLEGGQPLSISYNIHLNGDPTAGNVTITSGSPTFTPDA